MEKVAVGAPVLDPAEAVLTFLSSVGPGSEAELYLRLFRSRAAESFAAVAVDAEVVERDAERVAVDLRFLRALGLTPLVVLGLGAPASANAHQRVFTALLGSAGVSCVALSTAGPHAEIAAAARRGAIPVLVASGESRSERVEQLGAMLSALHTHKLIFLGPHGGLTSHGERLSVVNLGTDYDALLRGSELHAGQGGLVDDSRRLIFELVSHRLLVSLTSPLDLLHELFTVKGAGTLMRKGATITRHDGYGGVDLLRLRALLQASFGRPASETLFERPLEHAYVEEDYRGAALVMRSDLGGYLSKFAVTREAQGEGIGQDLWSALCANYASLLWRAKRDNPIRPWYERQCQGRFESGVWTVYFRGLRPSQVQQAVEFALSQPVDF
jgi:bifunctional N-acetylglutamate synthase/kinase